MRIPSTRRLVEVIMLSGQSVEFIVEVSEEGGREGVNEGERERERE